jgi:replicative DNA helicase
MPESNSKTTRRPRKAETIDPTYAHLQPQALELETAVLGALMIDKDAIIVVSDILKPESFYDPRHQKIYSAIRTLFAENNPIDIMTVTEQLKRDGVEKEVGGLPYIMQLSNAVSSSISVEYHAKIIAQKALARELISYSGRISSAALDPSVDANVLMQTAEGELFELSKTNMKQDYTQIDPILKEATLQLQKAAANTSGLTGVDTGYTELNNVTSGWQASDLIIIAGRPAMGKTSFALSLAKNIGIDHEVPVAFFSLEMSNVQLVNRLISNVCEISGKKILNGQLSDDEWARFDNNIRKMEGKPVYIDDTPALSVFELRTKARRLVREHGVKIIMIDYLQLMNATGMRVNSRQEEVSTISRSLKGLAKELDIPIIALSQLNRSVENRGDNSETGIDGHRPQLSDLRESGAIEQDADMVIFVHRPEYYGIKQDAKGNDLHGKAQIIIAKHRKGATQDVLLTFRGEFTRFDNPEQNFASHIEQDSSVIPSRMNTNRSSDDDDPFPIGEMNEDSDSAPY